MKSSVKFFLNASKRRVLVITAVAIVLLVVTATAFMQRGTSSRRTESPTNPASGQSQEPAVFSPDAITVGTYPFTNFSAIALEDMSSGTTQLVGSNQEDTASSVTSIGFDFWFDGVRQTQFSVNANGLLRLGSSAVGTTSGNNLASITNVPQIAPYWDDLYTGTNGKIHFKVVGSAPNRKLVVEWQNMQVPKIGNNNAGAGTFQCWLSESTGKIEFVYGSGIALNGANSGYSVGFGTSATVFASVTTSVPSVAYGTANNAQTNAITSGTKYTFTPVTPSDPTGLNFTAVTQTGMTLNWSDNSANEFGFAIYRSDDGGTSYNFVSQTAANATSSAQAGLLAGNTYFWKVFAVSEGALSANPAAGSNATSAAGNIVSTGAGGNWTNSGTWVGNVVPTATDNVTIADGATVTINNTSPTCLNLTVGQGTSGILEFANAPASTLTVNSNVTVMANATFTAGSGSLTTHNLNIGGAFNSIAPGNLTVDGTLDLNTTASVTTNFLGSSNGTVSGTGPTCNFGPITVTKGSNTTAILDVARVITMSAPTVAANRLSITGGTFKLSSASSITPYFGSQTITGVAGRLWINNTAASIQSVGAGVSATGAGSPTITGTLQIDAGTFAYGQGTDVMLLNGSLIIGGANATLNMYGRITTGAAATFNMSAGNFNVDPQNVTNAVTNDVVNFSPGSIVNFTGGTLTIVDPSANNAVPANTEFEVPITTAAKNFAGSTIRFGDGVSSTSGNASSGGFSLSVASNVTLGTVVINNPSGTNRTVRLTNAVSTTCNLISLTVTAGTFNLNGNLLAATGDIANDGAVNGDSTGSTLSLIGTTPQTISGAGTYTNGRIRGLTVNNSSGASPAVNLNQNVAVATALNLTTGTLGGIGTLTLGNSGGSSVLTTTRSSGSLVNTPTFDLTGVTYNVTYNAPSPAAITLTGSELPPTISGTLTVNNSSGVTLNSPLTVNTGLALSDGLLSTTAINLLTLGPAVTGPTGSATSYVNGPLAIDIPTTAAISRTFAIGKGGAFRPVTLSSLTLGAQSVLIAEVGNSGSGGTPVPPLSTLDPTRYWQLSNSAALNAGARIQLTYGADDNVFDTATARVGQASTLSGSYSSIGGTVSGTTTSGTILSTINLTPANDFFTIGNESALPTSWDGGAATTNWGDAANWSNDVVPDSTTDVSLSFGSPTTIDVNGVFSVKNLTIGTNTNLNLGSGTLNVTGTYIQANGAVNLNTGNFNVTGNSNLNGGSTNVNSGVYLSTGAFALNGGTLANGSGTLNCKANFTLSSGTFSVVTGPAGATTIFSGTAGQAISGLAGGTSLNNLTLQGGGGAKTFTAGRTITAANDFTVATTAQVALSAASATTINVGGNLSYGGLTGGANIGSLTLNLTGTGKTINGSALSMPQAGALAPGDVKTETVNLLTDPRTHARVPKNKVRLDSTYAKKRDEVNSLISKKGADTRLIINLDDATVVSNPTVPLSPTPSAFEMNLTVASGASYTMLDNISVATGRTLNVTGRLNADTFTIGGAGNITVTGSAIVPGNGTIGTASTTGLAATLINSGVNTFIDAIIDYNATGAQTIDTVSHPASAMIYTSGSGIKTLNGNKTISGDSGDPLTKGALFVGSGSTFADGGFTLSFTSATGFANVIVNGTYLSTGAGGLSYESGPFSSTIQAVNGTQFGNLAMNFDSSTDPILLSSPGTVNISFRNITFGGAAGAGTFGGTLALNQAGVTNVTVTGNVDISPLTLTTNGGGFGGMTATASTVTVLGNIATTSTAATQPIFDNNGTNTLIMGNPSVLQTLTTGANATIFTGAKLQVDNPTGLQLGSTPRTYTLGVGGTLLVSTGGSFLTGNNVFTNSGTTTVNGSFTISQGGAASGGTGTYNYHPTTGTLVFNTTSATTIDATRTYWPSTNGPQNVSVIGTFGLTMNVARTVGILFQTTAAVAGSTTLTVNGTCKINTGGSFSTAPTYGANSVLIYNTGGTFSRGAEWSATSSAGFPNDVQLSNNTTLNLGAGGGPAPGTARSLARDLTIDSGSTFSMAATPMTAALTVGRHVLINGTLTLSTSNGGNINVGGNWTNNSTFTNNGRTATFNGSAAQAIAGSSSSAFTGLTINNSAGVSLNTSGSVSGVLTLTTDLTVDSANGKILTATGSTSAGTGDVIGSVERSDAGTTTRAFGNLNNQITNGSAMTLRVLLVKAAPGTFTSAVNRTYSLNVVAGSVSAATVRLHYLNSELNGNTAATLHLWRASGSPTANWTDQGVPGSTQTGSDPNNWIQNTGVSAFSSWTLASAPAVPTAVKLKKFTARDYADGVQLNWESGYEVNNLGYHIYREQDGVRTRVTPAVVAGSALSVGPGNRLAAGYSYAWFDRSGNSKSAYYLEAIDLNGTRQLHGPVYPATVNNGNAPKRQAALLLNQLAEAAGSDDQKVENSWPAAMNRGARAQGLQITPAGLATQQTIAAGQAVKIQVNRSGWYRLSQPELLAAGLDPGVDGQRLQLFVDGSEVPIQLNSNGPQFDSNSTIEFYGVGLDTPTTDTRTYWLIAGDTIGKRIVPRGSKARERYQEFNSNPPVGSFLLTNERREQLIYSSHLLNGDASNIFGAPVLSEPVRQTLSISHLSQGAGLQPQLQVALQGLTSQAHAVEVQFNGSVVGTMNFTGSEHPVTRFNLERGLLHEGANEVSLTSRNGNLDISFIDSLQLSYPHTYRADQNQLGFTVAPGQTVLVGGFTTANVRVMDITDPNAPLELASPATAFEGSYAVLVPANGSHSRTLMAFTDDHTSHPLSVTANNPSNWNAGTNGADMVIITHHDFRQAVEPLAALRRSQGLVVAVADIEDVYDEFSYGAHTPLALKSFLGNSALNWSRKPEYLLLVGDSSWDPRNYFGQGALDFVPTKLVDTGYMETASDDWFADFADAGLPSMAIGRLPARTAAEAALMVAKILSFEQERELNSPLRGALLVADSSFESESAQTQNLLPSSISVETINRSDVGNDDVARGQIVNALNQGPMLVNYYGHGSLDVWTGAGLLDSDLALNLTNTNALSVYLMMTCLNGYSHDPYVESLGESVLKAPNGGAVAVWASSGFTDAAPQFSMNLELYRQLFGSQPVRLGQAIRNAKGASSDNDVRRTWILFGDPATRIR